LLSNSIASIGRPFTVRYDVAAKANLSREERLSERFARE
jgi:hypothetical protein